MLVSILIIIVAIIAFSAVLYGIERWSEWLNRSDPSLREELLS